jgi:hypothetical protein
MSSFTAVPFLYVYRHWRFGLEGPISLKQRRNDQIPRSLKLFEMDFRPFQNPPTFSAGMISISEIQLRAKTGGSQDLIAGEPAFTVELPVIDLALYLRRQCLQLLV